MKEQQPKPTKPVNKEKPKIIPVGLDFGFWDEETWLDAQERYIPRPVKHLEEPKDGKEK